MRTEGLTDRQLDVLELALQGLTNEQIARRLHVSFDTVKTHFKRAYAQLHDDDGRSAAGALHAVTIALRKGWLVFDPVSRAITRPPGRKPLPQYREPAAGPAAGTAGTRDPTGDAAAPTRSPAQRRRDLGW